jgi:hypothetical protein
VSPALVALIALAPLAQDMGGIVKWETDPPKAIQAARAAGKGMMLYFTSQG